MANNCGICAKIIKPSHGKLKCNDCDRKFHAHCLKMSKADVEYIVNDNLTWRCSPCSQIRRESLRFDSELEEGKLTLEDVMKKIIEITDYQRTQELNLNKSYELLSEKVDENTECFKRQNLPIENCLKVVGELIIENKRLNKKVSELELKIEDLEQYSKINDVEIVGLPMQPEEDVIRLVKEVGKAMDMTVTEDMLNDCYRLDDRLINVKFIRRVDKEEFLRKRRAKKNFTTRHLNLPTEQSIYVNQALTPAKKRLFAVARQAKKEEKKSLKERLQAIQEVTQTVQNSIGYMASLGESIKNTFNFTVPFLSYLSLVLLVGVAIILYWIPVRFLIMAWGVNKFARKLIRPHTVPNNEVLDLLSRVPTNEDLIQTQTGSLQTQKK